MKRVCADCPLCCVDDDGLEGIERPCLVLGLSGWVGGIGAGTLRSRWRVPLWYSSATIRRFDMVWSEITNKILDDTTREA